MINRLIITSFVLLLCAFFSFGQRAKNGDVTISGANRIVNAYARAVAGSTYNVGSTTVTVNAVANLALDPTGGTTTLPLQAGDLLLVIQMRGIDLGNVHTYDGMWASGWSNDAPANQRYLYNHYIAQVGNYKNSGKFERVQVRQIVGNTIHLTCGLQNSYELDGIVQIIRIPRYKDLTFTGAGSIVPQSWNGSTGGVVAIEVDGTLNLGTTNSSVIDASARGFRGGLLGASNGTEENYTHSNGVGAGDAFMTTATERGGNKGEGIFGDALKYEEIFSQRGTAAIANGGGGGGNQNAGGGGGSNMGYIGNYRGRGVRPTGFNATAWAFEQNELTFWDAQSSGGGRGGHSLSEVQLNPTTTGPNNTSWLGSGRKENGGLGGLPLAYDPARIYMGGGGGAGNQDSGSGGRGGNGGGIILIDAYGSITGTGRIVSNGEDGENSNPTNAGVTSSGSNRKKGNDGAGGAGGGGAILIRNLQPLPSTLTLSAQGGRGGDFRLSRYNGLGASGTELCGPGGGGQGGFLSFTSGSPTTNIIGGQPGIVLEGNVSGFSGGVPTTFTTPAHMANMPTNGATAGAQGLQVSGTTGFYDIIVQDQTICGGSSITLTAQVVGSAPSSVVTWYSTMTSTTPLATTNNYTFTPTPGQSSVQLWVGICPGTFRKPVTITISQSPALASTPTINHPTCTTPGSITNVIGTGGTNLTFAWSNGATSYNLDGVSAGTYTLTLTNDAGCSTTFGPYVLTGGGAPSLTTPPTITNQTCNGNGSLAGMVVNSSVAIQSIQMNGNVVSSYDQTLPAGSYTFVVTDVNGCIGTFGPYVIQSISAPSIAGTATIIDATCIADGSISGLSVTGGTAPITYAWNGNNSTDASLVAANGSYTLTATDAIGCTVTSGPHVIGMAPTPAISGTPVLQQPTCIVPGNITGLTASGGVGTLTYSWNGSPSTGTDLFGISAGSYTLTVTDANGCTDTEGPIVLIAPDMPVISGTAIVSPITCNGPATITGLTVTGGSAPYIYMYNTTINADANLSTTVAGTYTLNVGDANGCTVTSGPYQISEIALPTITGLAVNNDQTCTQLGQVGFTNITGGQAPYTVLWSDNASTGNTADVPAGTYTVTVTDDLGCSVTSSLLTVALTPAPTLNETAANVQNIPCQGNGGITGISVVGGVGPFTYSWNGVSSAGADLSTSTPGAFTLQVTDANGCVVQSNVYNLTQVGGPSIGSPTVNQPTCTSDGTITNINVTGGTAPYTATWNSNPVTAPYNLTVSNPGTYVFSVTDANGCVTTESFVINPVVGIEVLGTPNIIPATCTEGGGVTGLTYTSAGNLTLRRYRNVATSIAYSLGANPGLDLVNHLPSGTYFLELTDDLGCTASYGPIVIPGPDKPRFDFYPEVVQPTCIEGGSVTDYGITGGVQPYSYSWSPDNSTDMFRTNLDPGTYVLTVTDQDGCTLVQTYVMEEPASPTIGNATVVDQTCQANGSITGVQVTGGVMPYTFLWSNGSTDVELLDIPGGYYTVIAIGANGCEGSGQFTVGAPAVPTLSIDYQPAPATINTNVVFSANTNGQLTGYVWEVGGVIYPTGVDWTDSIFTDGGVIPVIVTAFSAEGCELTDTLLVNIFSDLIIPNVITANGDGVNDAFYLGSLLPKTYVLILDRWGNIVYESDDYDNNWKATDKKGNPVMDGVYTYLIKTLKGEQYHGFVTVVESPK